MKKVRVINPDGIAHHTRLIDVDTGEEIRGVTEIQITQMAGEPPMLRYTLLAEARMDLLLTDAETP